MRSLLTPRWIVAHVAMAVAVAFMLRLGGWQLARGIAGNSISWGYALQWPAFAGFAFFVWAREVRRQLRGDAESATSAAAGGRRAGGDATVPTVGGVNSAADGAAGVAPDDAGSARRGPVITRPKIDLDDAGDPALAEYNHYLAWLNANPGARPADYPG